MDTAEEAGTHHFEDVGDLGHVVRGEALEQRHAAQELQVVVDALQSGALHHLLEHAPVERPHFGARHGCTTKKYFNIGIDALSSRTATGCQLGNCTRL